MTFTMLDDSEIRYRLSKIRELPPLPTALKRLIECVHSEADTPRELESIITYDPGLSTKVLAVANSTFYGYREHVRTISKAIGVIGTAQVKAICIYTLLMGLFSDTCFIHESHREVLWKHAFACSRICVEVNRIRCWMSAEEAAVMGLLHDLGWIVMAAHLNEQFTKIWETAKRKNIPPWSVEKRYGFDHGKLGSYLARRWALPEALMVVMEFHHAPERSISFGSEAGLVYLVNVLSHSREYPELLDDEATMLQCRKLYVSEEEWDEYRELTEGVWEDVERLWDLLGSGSL